MIKCFKCKIKNGTIKVPSLEKKACSNCYARIIEKRFNKTVRPMNLKNVKISLKRPSDHVLFYLFQKRAKRAKPLKVSIGRSNINQSTLDDIAVSILKSFSTGKDYVIKEPAPLEVISEQELVDYAKTQGLEFKGNPREGQDKLLHDLLMKLNKRRPGVLYSIKDFMKKII